MVHYPPICAMKTMHHRSLLYMQAQKIRTRQTRHHMRVLEGVHFIASPTTFRTAPPIPRGATEGGHSDLALVGRLMQCVPPLAASRRHPHSLCHCKSLDANQCLGCTYLGQGPSRARYGLDAELSPNLGAG